MDISGRWVTYVNTLSLPNHTSTRKYSSVPTAVVSCHVLLHVTHYPIQPIL